MSCSPFSSPPRANAREPARPAAREIYDLSEVRDGEGVAGDGEGVVREGEKIFSLSLLCKKAPRGVQG